MATDQDPLPPQQAGSAGQAEADVQNWALRSTRGWEVHHYRELGPAADQPGIQSGCVGEWREGHIQLYMYMYGIVMGHVCTYLYVLYNVHVLMERSYRSIPTGILTVHTE